MVFVKSHFLNNFFKRKVYIDHHFFACKLTGSISDRNVDFRNICLKLNHEVIWLHFRCVVAWFFDFRNSLHVTYKTKTSICYLRHGYKFLYSFYASKITKKVTFFVKSCIFIKNLNNCGYPFKGKFQNEFRVLFWPINFWSSWPQWVINYGHFWPFYKILKLYLLPVSISSWCICFCILDGISISFLLIAFIVMFMKNYLKYKTP